MKTTVVRDSRLELMATIRNILRHEGYSEKVIEKIRKWYDLSEF